MPQRMDDEVRVRPVAKAADPSLAGGELQTPAAGLQVVRCARQPAQCAIILISFPCRFDNPNDLSRLQSVRVGTETA